MFTVGVILADHGRRGPPDAERLYTPERVRHALRGFDLLRCEEHTYEQQHRTGPREVTDSWRSAAGDSGGCRGAYLLLTRREQRANCC